MPQAVVLLCRQPIDLTIALLRALRGAGLRFDLPGTIFDQKPSCGISLAYKAVETHESPSVLAFLAECGAGLDVVDSLGQTPLWNACQLGKLALVQFLHQEGASLHTKGQRSVHGWMFNETGSGDIVDTRTSLKFSPLHMASLHGHLDVVRYLCLQGSIFADMLTLDGCSPLHLACEAGHTECVRWLHQQGADIERAYCGKLPFQVAFRNGHAGVAAYLRSCGVNECLGRGRLPDGLLRGYDVNVDGSSGKDRAENCPLPKPKRQSKRAFREGKRKKRTTPMKVRAERAGVLAKIKDTPPGLHARAEAGSPATKQQLFALQKHNRQVVDRAEVMSDLDQSLYNDRKQVDCNRRAAKKRLKNRAPRFDNSEPTLFHPALAQPGALDWLG